MEKTHDTIVGAKNSFKKAYAAMNSLSNNRIQTGINMVVTERNFKEIKGIIDLAKELHIDTVHLSTEYSIGIFNFFKNKSKNGSKITKDDYKTYEEQTRIMKKRIHDYLIEARNYALKKQVFCDFPTRLMNDALSLFINKQISKNKNKFNLMCSDLFKVRIDPEGKLTFCFLARNYFGSLREQTLQELINGNTLREARRRIANKQFIPLCEGCCKLEKIF